MPHIIVKMLSGRSDKQKQKLAKKITIVGNISNAINDAYKKNYTSSTYLSPVISNRASAYTLKIILK
ncbi:MAG: hypothetical protein EKK39_12970 [Sphingobacteriales bacterium]|uniref:tautomerase family protein n=1 Tax=Hydrotalea flava TaxID=714549 RepID=UPI0008325F6C|nr:tautomerase family protein [Hydrotalea flava]RTL48077.1 MAG: hypothetical protein EKK39_12970 [Sphingobacteriales bacterium]